MREKLFFIFPWPVSSTFDLKFSLPVTRVQGRVSTKFEVSTARKSLTDGQSAAFNATSWGGPGPHKRKNHSSDSSFVLLCFVLFAFSWVVLSFCNVCFWFVFCPVFPAYRLPTWMALYSHNCADVSLRCQTQVKTVINFWTLTCLHSCVIR